MNQKQIILNTVEFVKQELEWAEWGHDWWHICRVWRNAQLIWKWESADMFIVELWALLHDIADSKFHNWDEEIWPSKAREFLTTQDVEKDIIKHVENIIRYISFKGWNETQKFTSPELDIVQDADRLDALWAIWIARTFNYGWHKNRSIYDPNIEPNLNMSKNEYKNSTAPTINHFYEKLLLLKDKMNTQTGKQIAENRHVFMEQYLDQFYLEWKWEK